MAVRWRRLAIDVLIAVLATNGVALVVIGASPPPESGYRQAGTVEGPPGPPARGTTRSSGDKGVSPGTTPRGNGEPAPLGPSVPVHLDIPAIGVSTPLITLGLNADGTIAVPPLQRDAPAGWYRYLATPGEVGPAVILGHVDTARDGPAVFYRLHQLRPGDTVGVRRMDLSWSSRFEDEHDLPAPVSGLDCPVCPDDIDEGVPADRHHQRALRGERDNLRQPVR